MPVYLDTMLNSMQIPKTTPESAYRKQKKSRGYTLPKENKELHILETERERKKNAIRIYKLLSHRDKWKKKRMISIAAMIKSQRPSKATLAEKYLSKGDSTAVVEKLLEGYENLPAIKLNKKDYFVLQDVLYGNEKRHTGYIERNYK